MDVVGRADGSCKDRVCLDRKQSRAKNKQTTNVEDRLPSVLTKTALIVLLSLGAYRSQSVNMTNIIPNMAASMAYPTMNPPRFLNRSFSI